LTTTSVTVRPAGRLRLLLILGGITAIGPLSIDAYLPAFPRISDDLDAPHSAVQLTLAAFLLALAAGQLVVGPLSDAFGRRRLVLAALGVHVVASVAGALAPSVEWLIAARVVQGLAGGAGVVVSRAVVRDLFSGSDLTRFFARLTLVFGLAPIVAPVLGGLLLQVTGWRGIFWMLALVGGALVALAALLLPETLPPGERRHARPAAMTHAFVGLLRDRRFVGYTLALGLGFAAMFAYISGAPFVLQESYGVSAVAFGLLFGLNAAGLVAAGQLSAYLAGRVPERRTLLRGQGLLVGAGAVLLAGASTGWGGLWVVAGALFAMVTSLGLIMPNATALALAAHPRAAGTGSALLGFLQSVLGATAAPLVGLGPAGSPVPMAAAVAGFTALSLLGTLALTRGGPSRA